MGNALPILPMFAGFLSDHPRVTQRQLLVRSISVAYASAIALTLAGPPVFRALGIQVDDLRIAGGLILLIFSAHDLLWSQQDRKAAPLESAEKALKQEADGRALDLAAVPMGMPILVGPATLTTCLALSHVHGILQVMFALVVLALLNASLLWISPRMVTAMGSALSRAIGKVSALLLATLGVAMVRTGAINLWHSLSP